MRLATLFVLLLFQHCKGQSEREVIKEPYKSLWRVNNNIYYALDNKKKKLHLNGKAIDSTGLDLLGKVFNQNSIIGYSSKEGLGYAFYAISFDGKIEYLGSNTGDIFTTQRNFYVSKRRTYKKQDESLEYRGLNFYKLDLKSLALSDFFAMDKAAGLDSTDGRELCSLYEFPNGKLIAAICDCYGECLEFFYYLIDLKSGAIAKLDLNKKEPDNIELYRVRVVDSDLDGFSVDVFGAFKMENNGCFIYDFQFNEVSGCLVHESWTVGLNYKDERHLSDNIRSKLDDGKEVIIQYRFSVPVERSLSRIYDSREVFNEDISKMARYELEILENMVYAKHNFKFESEFYQAYFNYYEFYNSKSKMESRIKDVNPLLTAIDQKNLVKIRASLKTAR